MTAISAQSASETPSSAERTVLLPGSPATYANRARLRELGLRWDPERHQWHGTIPADQVRVLRAQLGLVVRCFGVLEPPRGPAPPEPPTPHRPTLSQFAPEAPAQSPRLPRDGSRTRFESRVLFLDEGDDEGWDDREFSLLEVTSGLPDDSREADERRADAHLRDLRGRVKAARAALATVPGAVEVLAHDWVKEAQFYARFGVTQEQFRYGIPAAGVAMGEDRVGALASRTDWMAEDWVRECSILPGSERYDG
ncbi:MAG: hypothetical protein ACREBZ_02555 [Thermoplasmata archaeon]